MRLPDDRRIPARAGRTLEEPLAALEDGLSALGQALQQSDVEAVDRAGSELQRALAAAVEDFRHAARCGAVPAPLRRRLAEAGARVAAQREALARATASLDRAIDVLLPRPAAAAVYSSGGLPKPLRSGHRLLA
jgi:hypothetical protein